MTPTCKVLCSLALILGTLAGAQAETPSATAGTTPNNWEVKAADAGIPYARVRLNGTATHGEKTSAASMEIACYSSRDGSTISLITRTDKLNFDPGIYEGPQALSTGPLFLTTETLAAHRYRVNGYYLAVPADDGRPPFILNMRANRQELRDWVAEKNRGRLIRMQLPSPLSGDAPLIAEFVLPQNTAVLHNTVKSCLARQQPRAKKPA